MSQLKKQQQTSKDLILNLEQFVQLHNRRQQNTKYLQAAFSHLKKINKQQQVQQKPLRKSKIKKSKKSEQKKLNQQISAMTLQQQEDNNNFLEYLKCKQQLDEQFLSTKKSQQFDQMQKQMLDDFVINIVQDVCYQNDRRKSLFQIQPKQFLNILIRIEYEFYNFVQKIHKEKDHLQMNARETKLNNAYLETLFIHQILLNIPEIKEVLQNFEEKYSSNEQYKNQYKQLLMKKKVIFGIKRIIDRQCDSQQQRYCCDLDYFGTQPQWTRGSQFFSQPSQVSSTYNRWQDIKLRLHEFQIKVEEESKSIQKKKRKTKKKRVKQEQDQKIEQQQNQKMQIDHSKTIQCRLDEQWMDKFRKKKFNLATKGKLNKLLVNVQKIQKQIN